jgi:hypothetical protein
MGQGTHTDVVTASALAFVNALNRLDYRRRFRQLAPEEGP